MNKVSYDDGINDTSQSGRLGCQECHGSGPQGGPYSLASWSDILLVHNNSCYTCHDYANEPNVGDNTPLLTDVQAAIANPGSGVTCATCHVPKVPNVDHGGHPVDFGWAGGCDTCHNDAIYGTSGGPNVLNDVHHGDCSICHSGTPTRDNEQAGSSTNGVDGDAHLADGTAQAGSWASKTCLTCHPTATYATGVVHHVSKNAYAADGNCSQCHTDPRTARGNRQIQALLCSECHVKMNGSTMEIVAITMGKEGGAGNGTDSGNTYTAITTSNGFSSNHTFPNSGGVINDYGTCFECHGYTGKTGYTSAPRMFPYHALPKPGAYSTTDNTIGGNGWQNNLGDNGIARFRGDQNWNLEANNSYFPIGKGRLNIGYAQHSLATHASENTPYKAPNQGAPDTYMTMTAGLSFGTVTHPSNSVTYFIPNYDPVCTSSDNCDDITVNTSVTMVGSRPNLGFDLRATSSTGAALHVIFGGRHIGSFSSGNTFSFRWAEKAVPSCSKNCDYQNTIPMDIFNSENNGPVWVVSEDGGAVNAGTPDPRDWSNLDIIQAGLPYPGTDWPQQ